MKTKTIINLFFNKTAVIKFKESISVKIYMLFALFLIPSFGICQTKDHFTLRGKIDNAPFSVAKLNYFDYNRYKWVEDSAKIVKDNFLFQGTIAEPTCVTLTINDKKRTIYLEPAIMNILIRKGNLDKAVVNGSKTQNEYEPLYSKEKMMDAQVREFNDQLEGIDKRLESTKSNKDSFALVLQKDRLFMSRDSINNKLAEVRMEFISANPNSFVSLNYISFFINDKFPEKAINAYNKLSPEVKSSIKGKDLERWVVALANSCIGGTAPDFSAPDANGQMVTLSDFRGKNYVLLDFWASWCGPCLQAMPHIKEIYAKYHDKGLKIIGISRDRNKEEWLTSIKDNNLGLWYQVLANSYEGTRNIKNIDVIYYPTPIPFVYLLDKDGKVIERWNGYTQENESGMDAKMKELFGE